MSSGGAGEIKLSVSDEMRQCAQALVRACIGVVSRDFSYVAQFNKQRQPNTQLFEVERSDEYGAFLDAVHAENPRLDPAKLENQAEKELLRRARAPALNQLIADEAKQMGLTVPDIFGGQTSAHK